MKEEVLEAFDGLFEALLTRGDPHEAMSRFADGDVIFWSAAAQCRASTRTGEGEAAWVSAIGHFSHTPADGPPNSGPYRVTAVFVRRDGRWLWHTYSGSEPVD